MVSLKIAQQVATLFKTTSVGPVTHRLHALINNVNNDL